MNTERGLGRGLATLALTLASSALPAAESSNEIPFFRHASFADFAAGQVSAPGTGLYVARQGDRGEIRWISRHDNDNNNNNNGFTWIQADGPHSRQLPDPGNAAKRSPRGHYVSAEIAVPVGLASGFIEVKARLGHSGSVAIEVRGSEQDGTWQRLDRVEHSGDILRFGPAPLAAGGQFQYRLVLEPALLGDFPVIEEVTGKPGNLDGNGAHMVPRLYWNGAPVEPGAALAVTPGRMHMVEVHGATRDGWLAVRHWRPDGTIVQAQKPVLTGGAARVELGPLLAPARYEFEAGVVYRRGYGLEISLLDGDSREMRRWQYAQGLATPETEQLVPDAPERAVYVAGWGHQRGAGFRLEEARRMRPVLDLRLDPAVLSDSDRLTLRYASQLSEPMAAVVRIADERGGVRFEREIEAGSGQLSVVEAAAWPAGDYRVTLWPRVEERLWQEGPELTYRRRQTVADAVRISPLAPWTLERDSSRGEVLIDDLRAAHARWSTGALNETYWRFDDTGALLGSGNAESDPVELALGLEGWHAVFVAPAGGRTLVQAGAGEPRRVVNVAGPFETTFVTAVDMTGERFRIHPLQRRDSGVIAIRLVPVTEESVHAWQERTSRLPTPLYGSNDWSEYFHAIGAVGDWSPATDDQLGVIVAGQAERGIRDIGWAIGRSVLSYRSALDHVTMQTAWPGLVDMLGRLCPLGAALEAAPRSGSRIWAFLAMNRHYAGPPHSSAFYLDNPAWRHIHKDGTEGRGRMSYFFPEVRRERLDILLDVARRGVYGLQVCAVRQVPMMSYHPGMTAVYLEQTGLDPRTIDATHGAAYQAWIRWRADFFTQLLRDLRAELRTEEAARGEPVPVAVRLPSAGLFWNLAQGLDVETWMAEGLVQRVLLHPLDDSQGRANHDVRPYVALGRAHNVEVYGGMGATAFVWSAERQRGDQDIGHVPVLRRALGLLEAYVHGIEIYEAEFLAMAAPHYALASLWGDAKGIREWLTNSNLEACFPVTSMNACRGFDNHSFRMRGWNTQGFGRLSL